MNLADWKKEHFVFSQNKRGSTENSTMYRVYVADHCLPYLYPEKQPVTKRSWLIFQREPYKAEGYLGLIYGNKDDGWFCHVASEYDSENEWSDPFVNRMEAARFLLMAARIDR